MAGDRRGTGTRGTYEGRVKTQASVQRKAAVTLPSWYRRPRVGVPVGLGYQPSPSRDCPSSLVSGIIPRWGPARNPRVPGGHLPGVVNDCCLGETRVSGGPLPPVTGRLRAAMGNLRRYTVCKSIQSNPASTARTRAPAQAEARSWVGWRDGLVCGKVLSVCCSQPLKVPFRIADQSGKTV